MSHKQINSLENLASKQRILRIFKEQHGFMQTVRSKDCSAKHCASQNNLNIAPVWISWQVLAAPKSWWSQSGSNRRPSRCKRDALPAELWPLVVHWPKSPAALLADITEVDHRQKA
jgi:hypothetical protein